MESDAAEATYPWTDKTPADFQSDVVVNGDSVMVVVRNDDDSGMIGQGTLVDGNMKWQRMNKKIIAPCFLQVDSKTTFLLLTEYRFSRELKLYKVKGTTLQLLGTFPSNGDCGYMGAAVFQDYLYISYYSTVKAGQAAIYMATIPLRKIMS